MGGAGSNYNGWQFQHDQPSIQGLLETVLSRKLQQPIRVVGVSCPCPPPMLVGEPAQEREQKLKMGCMLYRIRLKVCTMGRSVAHRHWRPLTRPGLAPLPRVSALARWGGALPRPLMGLGFRV
jgi:hypothetical protein